jgi:hypothetical protein
MQEAKIIEYFEIFVQTVTSTQVHDLFGENAQECLATYLNITTVERRRTALHMAAQNNRRVSFT